MKEFAFIGIDISSEKLDWALIDQPGTKPLAKGFIENSIKGIKQLIDVVKKKSGSKNLKFCFENTGNYGVLLCCILEQQSLWYSQVPALEIKQSFGMIRGKNDQIDAIRIAEYAMVYQHKIKQSKLGSTNILQLKELISLRDLLVRQRTQLINSLKSRKKLSSVIDNSLVLGELEEKIKTEQVSIKRIEKQIKDLIDNDQELKKNYQLATSVIGIGLVATVLILVYTQNFNAIDDSRKFNCYSGIAPFESSSGKYKGKTKVSQLGYKKIKTTLNSGANSAITNDPEIRNYYKRKMSEGKDHKQVVNAIACKLVARVFAVVKRGTPFVTTYENKIQRTLV